MRAAVAGLAFAVAVLARADHRGLPPLGVFPQSLHRGGAQTFDAAQDRQGVLYFGNLAGVITYDGAWWSTIPLPNESAVFAVESDDAGVIAVGGVGELGYLDSTPAYHSLLDQLPPHARDVGEVRGICTAGRGFVFTTDRFTIEWKGGAPRVLAQHRNDAPPNRCSTINGVIYVWGGDGLLRLEQGMLVAAGFAGLRLEALTVVGGQLVTAVRDGGLQTLIAGAATPFAPEASAWLAGKRVSDAALLRDGRTAITTRDSGLVILRPDGAVDEILGPAAGLPDDVLLCALADREGALWLAYYGLIVRVDLASPVTVLDARRGLRGSARTMIEHDGKLWIPTMRGVYVLEGPTMNARRIEGIDTSAWCLLVLDGDLLVGTNEGVYRMRGTTRPARVAGTENLVVYEMQRSREDPSRVWLGARSGVAKLQDGSRYDGMVAGSPRYARSIVERNGELWVGTVFDGVVRIARDGTIARYGSGEMDVVSIAGRILFVGYPGSILEPRPDGTVAPDHLLGHIKSPPDFFRIAEDGAGNVWINSDPPRVLVRQKNVYAREPKPLGGIGIDIQVLQYLDGAMWFSTSEGLFRYAPHTARGVIAQPAPLIRRVVAGTETLLTNGIARPGGAVPLPYAFRRLRIEFAPVSYRSGVAYQYRLDPLDPSWSEWSANPFIDYTHLEDGSYTFRLRARSTTGTISDEAVWSFTVRPPWYRTHLMLLLGLLAAAALVGLIVMLRTRALRRQAERLRGLVDERTRELARTVDALEDANHHLERLSLLDELTGIPNRRYFDRALAQTWEAAMQTAQPLSLILLDLDHFKLLNDAKGHPAGDASLIEVARLLAQCIRRSGDLVSRGQDVVARIGGEEFAILLSNTDAQTAARIAETLRASIQEMVIAFESSNLKVTVSCGVATTTSAAGDTAERLVRRADRALYAAKAAGRNCVREDAA